MCPDYSTACAACQDFDRFACANAVCLAYALARLDWAQASGARAVLPLRRRAPTGPRGGRHQAGTGRRGTDPAASAADARGTVWGYPNLHVVDGSLPVTNGGVNPVLTILALAYQVSRHVAALAGHGPVGIG